jgi:hypothetical protein
MLLNGNWNLIRQPKGDSFEKYTIVWEMYGIMLDVNQARYNSSGSNGIGPWVKYST